MSHLRLPRRPLALVAVVALPLALTSCTNAEARSACQNVETEIGEIGMAAQGVYQDYVEDGIEPQEQHLDILDVHYEDMVVLEENLSGNKQETAFERTEAVAYLLDGIDEQDPSLVAEGADRMAETEEAVLDAC
ncbi:hypothetical protein [Nocardiopsis salina]|uniref:hypothetical protein n=1 Tax=Nocardiopsis salina TaxID=245836 RepID=UPI00034524E3|nr:hypothetical protein [Nocardiopsis salina]